MTNRTEKKRLLILLAVGALFLFYNNATLSDSETSTAPAALTETAGEKRLIYVCRLENEESPAVEIFEVRDDSGEASGTLGVIDAGEGMEFSVGQPPVWGYQTVGARSEPETVEVVYEPLGNPQGYDWTLTLADENRFFKARVRDCQEIADE